MDRREFLKASMASGVALVSGACSVEGSSADAVTARAPVASRPLAPGMYAPPIVSPEGLTLRVRETIAETAPGVRSRVLTYGDGPVGPTIVAHPGQRATIEMVNELDEPTIVHWHGLRPPEAADGHPRLAVGSNGTYRYDFEVDELPGLYWYHSHAHMRTGPQVYHGLAGLFIVRGDDDSAAELPAGDRELTLVLQDKVQDDTGQLVYNPMGHQMMEGFLGNLPFVNGTRPAPVAVDSALYRLRVLAAANARIYRLALSNGQPLRIIGSDVGLFERPTSTPFVDIGTGERADLLMDFAGLPVGTVVTLRSLEFTNPYRGMGMGGGMMGGGMMGGGMMGGAGVPQGAPLDLVEFVVSRDVRETARVPASFAPLPRLDRGDARRERVFRFQSAMMNHTINGRPFEMDRVDESIPFGSTEVWRFVNDAPFPHPVHMHATHFQVLSRTGGRGTVFPWELGWKDTVLVYPGEEVEVIARFDRHRGLFLLHCHNLEHEDMGMMMNFVIE